MPDSRRCAWLAVLVAAPFSTAVVAQQFDEARFAASLRPMVTRYCVECHSTARQKGDLDLERFASLAALRSEPGICEQVFEHLRSGDMPPMDKPQPTAAERERMLADVDAVLAELARADAGDPGPVLLRRLSNAEYTFTIRDLTGVDALDPAREFPVDGAAGEGFTNVGNALVVSPALLTKYFDAAKAIAAHAVLLPDGIRFASGTTRRDCTEELLAAIRALYRHYTDDSAGDAVDLQGIVFTTNGGGRLPLAKYLTAALACRDGADVAATALAAGVSAKYLRSLLQELTAPAATPLLAPIGAAFRQARADDVPALVAAIAQWQRALWQFRSVGHIGKLDGPKAWMEPVDALVPRRELQLAVPAAPDGASSTVYLVARDAGNGTAAAGVLWQQPRLRAPGRPDVLLRDVRAVARGLDVRRERMLGAAARCLAACDEASVAGGVADVAALARRHEVEPDALAAWLEVLGIAARGPVVLESLFAEPLAPAAGAPAIRGWGRADTPSLVANASDQAMRIPGLLKAHGVALHPAPKVRAAVGWRSPVAATVSVAAVIEHVHHDCGNGVTWAIELRRGATRQRLADGVAHREQVGRPAVIPDLVVGPGDFVSVLIGARNGDHTCDLTAVDCVITAEGAHAMRWDLAADVADDVLAGNPHADRLGNAAVWHFYSESDDDHGAVPRAIPPGSLLAQWSAAASGAARVRLAASVQELLVAGGAPTSAADADLRRQLGAAHGVLLGGATNAELIAAGASVSSGSSQGTEAVGLDPASFGKDGTGAPIDAASLWVRAPSVLAIALPAELAAGAELVVTGELDAASGATGCVQLQVSATPPAEPVVAGHASLVPGEPLVAAPGSAAWARGAEALAAFRRVFPAAVCYARIVPVDEVVTLTLFHREDEPLLRLVLEDDEARRLDRLWQDLRFVSQDALTLVDAFDQIWQFATQDGDPKVFEPLREPIRERAAAFRRELAAAEPKQLAGVLEFADRAWRRELSAAERDELSALYRQVRDEGLAHDEAIRLLLARVLIAPAFLYRSEVPGPGAASGPVTDDELASRLSYFLSSSAPDAGLRALAAAGRLRDADVLAVQARRLLGDQRVRRLAREFACAWLHLADFDTAVEKSERHFPTFAGLRPAMQEEVVRFFTDLFQRDGSVLDVLTADHTFVDAALAAHYELPAGNGDGWRRVDGMRARGRGGVLGMAAVLAAQSGASRTSPILRGNWVSEVLLGERLPRPPKDVPRLPDDEGAQSLSMRELTARHSSDARCAHCHARIDGFGFALESFDAIGRWRERDLGDRAIDTRGTAFDGAQFSGLAGLRDYLATTRRDAFLRQFLRKLLGYALGRAVLLSDRPLLDDVLAAWPGHEYRVGFAIEAIVRSRQFREIRGREARSKD